MTLTCQHVVIDDGDTERNMTETIKISCQQSCFYKEILGDFISNEGFSDVSPLLDYLDSNIDEVLDSFTTRFKASNRDFCFKI